MSKLITKEKSILGDPWVPIFETSVNFGSEHFLSAMSNLIREPNINSTVIMRSDILSEVAYENGRQEVIYKDTNYMEIPRFPDTNDNHQLLYRDLTDIRLREIPVDKESIPLEIKSEIIRRIIPRNPYKDHIINQTCLVLSNKDQSKILIVYVPHINEADEIPFYLPPVLGVGILFEEGKLTVHYLPFEGQEPIRELSEESRAIRIALRLLQTSAKHSKGVKEGYKKRVNHDLVVPKESFQNRYIALKKKYSAKLVKEWVESTDPKKHVFEDLAIAAFLIELWGSLETPPSEFRDLGCGNGLLVYILNSEGFKGKGIDARARKSWKSYPKQVQDNLLEQVIIPSVLLKPHPEVTQFAPQVTDNGRVFQIASPATAKNPLPLMTYYTSSNLLNSTQVCTVEFPENTFIIGNHSDELTCWIPLLGYPFAVIPCCSHALSGSKIRFNARKGNQDGNSTYASLVDHVEDLANAMGWEVKKEMLRIPSTRNAAIIGLEKKHISKEETPEAQQIKVIDIIASEGGAEGWVENTMALMKKAPRNH